MFSPVANNHIKLTSFLSLICALYFFITIPLSHLLKPDMSFSSDALSLYALGQNGWLLTSGFYAISLNQVLLSLLILQDCNQTRSAGILLLLAGVGALLVAVFPTQINPVDIGSRLPHIIGAVMQFFFFPLSLLKLSTHNEAGHSAVYTNTTAYLTLAFFFILLALFFFPLFKDFRFFGLLEKTDILLINFWLIYQSYKLNKRPLAATSS